MRLTTFNILWLGTPDAQARRTPDDEAHLVEALRRIDASVSIIQEVVSLPLLEGLLLRAAAGGRRRYALRDAAGGWLTTGRMRHAVSRLQKTAVAYDASELSLLEFRAGLDAIRYPGPRLPALVRVRHASSGLEVAVVGAHLKSGFPEEAPDSRESLIRRAECEALVKGLSDLERDSRAVVLLGDLNATRHHHSLRPLVDGLPGWTWHSPRFRPDAPGEHWTAITRRTVVDHALSSPAATKRISEAPEVWAFDLDPTFPPGPAWWRERAGFTVTGDDEEGPRLVENLYRISDHRPLTIDIDV